MINVTEKFIQLLNANSRTFRMKLVNGSDEYTNILNLKWFAALPSYLSIGNAICTCVECKAVGIPISIKGTYLDVYITVIGSDEWVQIGTFKAEKPTLQNGVVSFSAYDVMNECSKAIFAHKRGTVTIGECYETVIADIESEIGTVSYVPLPSSVAFNKINADLLIGYDCRNVLAYIAGYLGCNCVVNNTGAIEMRGFTVCDYTLNDNRIAEPELDDNVSDLEFLACSVNSDTKLLYGNNGEGFEFICPIMTQERLNQIGATLCASASVVNVYRSGKINHLLGDLRLQIGDVVSLEHNGETHTIPISSIAFEFDGGLSADIEALPLAEASALSLSDTLDFISKQNANKRITGITNYYLATSETEGVTKDRSDWTDTIQSISADKKYLWNYEVIKLADGTTYETEPCIIGNFAENGSNGRGIKSITEYYLTTQTESTPAKSNFKDIVQTPTESLPFLWNYEKIEYDDDSKPYESEVRIIGVYGTKGSDGKTYYTWIKYADDASGTNMSDDPTGKKYMGIAINKTTATESNDADVYTWSLIKGTDGKGVSKVETWYYLSTSETALVSGSWSTSAPTWTDGTYLWIKLVTTYTDGDTEESDPVVDASWKKTSAVEKASIEFNESLINALGLYVTEVPVSGTVVKYYHSKSPLASCGEGDIILLFNSSGFGVCTTGWNDGKPDFDNGMEFGQGKAIWNILAANKISADLIEAGVIKSIGSAAVQTKLNLNDGCMSFETGDTIVTIKGAETDSNGVEHDAGIAVKDKRSGDGFAFSLSGLAYCTFEYALAMFQYFLSGGTIKKPEDPYFSTIEPLQIKTKDVHCQNIFMLGSDGEEYSLLKELSSLVEQVESLSTSLSALQTKYNELLESIGQTCDHSSTITKKENVVEATCETAGSYDSVVYCATCNEEISREEITVEALGHNYTSVVTPPTATAQGYTTHTCSRCGDSYVDSYTDPTGSETTESMTVKLTNGSNSASEGDSFYFSNDNEGTDDLGTERTFVEGDGYVWVVAKPGTGRKLVRLEAYVNGELADSQTLDQTSIWATTIMYMADYAGKTVEYKMYFSGAGTSTFIVSKGGDTTSADSVQIFDSSYNSIGTTAEVSYGESIHIEGGTVSGRQITSIEVVVDGVSSGTISSSDLISVGYLTSSRTTVAMPVNFVDPNWAGTTREYIIYFASA